MARKITVVLLSFLSLLLPYHEVLAQDRCSTTKYELIRRIKRPARETPEQFEQWIRSRLLSRAINQFPSTTSVFTIPVVVHILHNGTTDPTNISDAQVGSQIAVLNKDFQRMNMDASNTPPQFSPVAGILDIQFVLAKRDPEGLATSGITRTLATKTQWTLDDQSELKALRYWPAEDYLNIWVINFGTNDIGFAQFPVTSTLPGLELASEDRLTDGVVIHYRAFGSSDDGAFNLDLRFNKGRTATHEVGHFFGLRHIWGDVSGCADSDFVPDTPPQNGPTSNCPIHPQISCGGNKMFMNYMDYTNDACMNLFTTGQFSRTLVVLAESPRRVSLTTSLGATDPLVASNDLGIRSILSPTTSICTAPLIPKLEVRNYGTNTVTTVNVELTVNSILAQTKTFPLNLAPNQIGTLTFDPITLLPGSTQPVNFAIIQTNSTTDGNASNNVKTVSVSIPLATALPISELFSSTPPDWTVSNPDNLVSWTNLVAPDNSPSNRAMSIDYYNYENEGVLDWIITPAFALTMPSTSQLRFDIAYAQYPGQSGDVLRVYALPGCNPDLSQAILLYNKSGSTLATAPSTGIAFTPTNAGQWRKSEVLSLSGLNPSVTWQLAFVGTNGYGNNLYLDNVVVSEDELNDIAITGIASPGIVHCLPNPAITFYASNLGTSDVTSFRVDYKVNSGASQTLLFSSIQLAVGEQKAFVLNPVSLSPGTNEITITLSEPNGIQDISSNNSLVVTSLLDQSQDKAPLRMTFDNTKEIPWHIASPANSQAWEPTTTTKDQSLTYRSFTNTQLGQDSWLVSPVLDLSPGTFSMFFDVSYAQNMPADDRLRILASTDCGVTYDQVLMDRAASTFTSASSSSEWFPGTDSDWSRQYVNLSSLSGQKNIRIAYVVQNDNGNNLYVDNIELFAGDDSNPPVTTASYQLYYTSQNTNSDVALTFNLSEKQDVRVQIFAMQGNLVSDTVLPETLNQTYYYDLSTQAAGIYLFRLLIANQPSVTKVFIGH